MATLEEGGEDVLDLGLVEGSTRERGRSFCLAGRLCTSRQFNVYALMDVMVRAFKSRTKAVVREWGNNLLIFTFADEKDRDWVVRNQPWNFNGNLFVVKPLSGSEQPLTVTISTGSFWTRAYDILVMYQTKPGGVMEVFEPPDEHNLGSYLRFKMAVDIMKPLVRGLRIRVNAEMEFGPFLKASSLKKGRGPKVENKVFEHREDGDCALPKQQTSSFMGTLTHNVSLVNSPGHISGSELVEPSSIQSGAGSGSSSRTVDVSGLSSLPRGCEDGVGKWGVSVTNGGLSDGVGSVSVEDLAVVNPSRKGWKHSAREKANSPKMRRLDVELGERDDLGSFDFSITAVDARKLHSRDQ
ncbi:hypothetical protein ACS0TY_032306 [Phlomoides rotata]